MQVAYLVREKRQALCSVTLRREEHLQTNEAQSNLGPNRHREDLCSHPEVVRLVYGRQKSFPLTPPVTVLMAWFFCFATDGNRGAMSKSRKPSGDFLCVVCGYCGLWAMCGLLLPKFRGL
jgi:hypothetical protein